MLLAQVISTLRRAIMNPVKGQVTLFIDWVMDGFITEENLRTAIEEDVDILTLAFNHFGLGHSAVTPLIRIVFKYYWDEVESIVTDANRVYEIIARKPECAKIISTKEGNDYLNRCCEAAYANLYDFLWR